MLRTIYFDKTVELTPFLYLAKDGPFLFERVMPDLMQTNVQSPYRDNEGRLIIPDNLVSMEPPVCHEYFAIHDATKAVLCLASLLLGRCSYGKFKELVPHEFGIKFESMLPDDLGELVYGQVLPFTKFVNTVSDNTVLELENVNKINDDLLYLRLNLDNIPYYENIARLRYQIKNDEINTRKNQQSHQFDQFGVLR